MSQRVAVSIPLLVLVPVVVAQHMLVKENALASSGF
jgi:hypothetical protein